MKCILVAVAILVCVAIVGSANAQMVQRVADINPGAAGSSPYGMTLHNGEMYFAADDGTNGTELMKFDGSSVTRLSDINTAGSSKVQDLISYNNELYFRAYDGSSVNLWKYDGSSVSQVTDATTGQPIAMVNTASPRPENRMAVYNGKLYLEGWSNDLSSQWGLPGGQLWEYDAATGQGNRISDIHTLTWDVTNYIGSFGPEKLTVYNGKLYMQGTQASYDDPSTEEGWVGTEIWSYDGSSLDRVSHFSGTYNPGDFHVHTDGKMYMSADMDDTTGSELVSFDGTDFTLENDAISGTPGGGASNMASYNGDLYYVSSDSYMDFNGDPYPNNQELWKYDGVDASLVADINTHGTFPASFPEDLTVFDGKLFFAATTGDLYSAADEELWVFDGTDASLFADINSSDSSAPSDFLVFDGKLYFSADDGVGGRELFVVPEPATLSLLALGGLAIMRRRRTA